MVPEGKLSTTQHPPLHTYPEQPGGSVGQSEIPVHDDTAQVVPLELVVLVLEVLVLEVLVLEVLEDELVLLVALELLEDELDDVAVELELEDDAVALELDDEDELDDVALELELGAPLVDCVELAPPAPPVPLPVKSTVPKRLHAGTAPAAPITTQVARNFIRTSPPRPRGQAPPSAIRSPPASSSSAP